VVIFTVGEEDVATMLAILFWVRVGARLDLNQSSVVKGVNGAERSTDPCTLQPEAIRFELTPSAAPRGRTTRPPHKPVVK
jgi:hypothetical protein